MSRRTKAEIDQIKRWIHQLCQDMHPMTVRQLFYQLTTHGVIDKTEAEYKQTVCRLTAVMRLAGELPWYWLSDNTRWIRKPDTYGSLDDCLEQAQRAYRRSLWDPNTNDQYVEVWLEKDALSGVLYEVTREYDVPLMVTRGYPSLSYQHSAAMGIKQQLAARGTYGEATIYYFGDFDPSGADISRSTEQRLREFVGNRQSGWLNFKRVAVNHDQIAEMNLPTRPTKTKDSRSKNFGFDYSCEVDSIRPDVLRSMVRTSISAHIDTDQIKAAQEIERHERELLQDIRSRL